MKSGMKAKKIFVNALSISRVIGALFMPLFLNIDNISALIAIMAILLITDMFDGMLARGWHVQTIGGSLLDPLGDKVLAISCLIAVIKTDWILFIPLVLELTITVINVVRVLNEEEARASLFGKVKTWILSITLIIAAIYKLDGNLLNEIFSWVFGLFGNSTNFDLTITKDVVNVAASIAITAQFFTIISYVKESIEKRRKGQNKDKRITNFKALLIRLFDETKFKEDREKPLMQIIREVGGGE